MDAIAIHLCSSLALRSCCNPRVDKFNAQRCLSFLSFLSFFLSFFLSLSLFILSYSLLFAFLTSRFKVKYFEGASSHLDWTGVRARRMGLQQTG